MKAHIIVKETKMANLPEYTPTEWVDDSTPALEANNLNNIEQGIKKVTDTAIELKDNPATASETVLGSIKMWTTTDGEGLVTGHISAS